MSDRMIYADNAATTPLSQGVLEEMISFMNQTYANPSSIYKSARNARTAVENARDRIAAVFGCSAAEIFFTSGGTESDNWAIKGTAELMSKQGKNHIITTAIEHPAVLNSCRYLEKQGFRVTYLPINKNGLVSPEQIAHEICDKTALVSVMYVNNEIGTIMPITEIARICHEKKVYFHTDAVQAAGNIPIDISQLGADMLSISGHKLHAPKGVGLLYIRKGITLPPLIHGGAQEKGMRAGTENTAAIIGLARACEEHCTNVTERAERITKMRNYIVDKILEKTPKAQLNGSREYRTCGNINISFEGTESESLVMLLDMKGICASGGSACASGSLEPSHVITALGNSPEAAKGSLRLTIDETLSYEDADYIIDTVAVTVERIRKMRGW